MIYWDTDFQKVQIKAILNSFPSSNIILCWFHDLKNIKKKIPFLNSKNTIEKKMSKDIIANLKSLFFIPHNLIESFYRDIKNKYNSKSYIKFFK